MAKCGKQRVGQGEDESAEKFTFFFGAESPFSQWHFAAFTVEGVEYNCAEQFMMHQKAGEPVEASHLSRSIILGARSAAADRGDLAG